MKKDQADEFEQELLQPLAKALRTTLKSDRNQHIGDLEHICAEPFQEGWRTTA
jgi:hypothetical protein